MQFILSSIFCFGIVYCVTINKYCSNINKYLNALQYTLYNKITELNGFGNFKRSLYIL